MSLKISLFNGEEEGLIDGEESDIIQAAVDFNDITVKSILTPKRKNCRT